MTNESAFYYVMIALVGSCLALGIAVGRLVERHKHPQQESAPICIPADTLSDWQALTLAIALTESRCNPSATGKTQDAGILQLTPIYVREANRVGGTDYAHSDAYDPLKSLYMFEAVQSAHNPKRDENRAIKLHNPGGASIGYPQKVKQNLELIKRIEAVRSALKEYEYRNSNESNPGGAEAVNPGNGN